MHTFLNKSMPLWKGLDEDVLQFTVSFVSVIALPLENFPSTDIVKLFFSLITFGTQTETCLTLNKEPNKLYLKFTWLVTFSQQFVKL